MVTNIAHSGELHTTKAETASHWLSSAPVMAALALTVTIICVVAMLLIVSRFGTAKAEKVRADDR